MCRTDGEVADQVRRTVIHEVAHHFGIGDARLKISRLANAHAVGAGAAEVGQAVALGVVEAVDRLGQHQRQGVLARATRAGPSLPISMTRCTSAATSPDPTLSDRLSTTVPAAPAEAAARGGAGIDGYSFVLSFKGVLLEGLEVVFIVLTFGANQHRVGLAAIAAGVAVLLVVLLGVAARAPLARVPENAMKFAVGVMLTSFGMFWGGEGAGASWPGSDAALLVIVPAVLALSVATVAALRRGAGPAVAAASPAQRPARETGPDRGIATATATATATAEHPAVDRA